LILLHKFNKWHYQFYRFVFPPEHPSTPITTTSRSKWRRSLASGCFDSRGSISN